MKAFIATLFFSAILFVTAQAQVTGFHEDFEIPGQADSVVSSQTGGTDHWQVNGRLQAEGQFSDSCQVKTATTCTLTTSAFSTVGYSYIHLEFDQICKVDIFDLGRLQVSADSGLTWTFLTGAQYQGSGLFGSNGGCFNAASYGTAWQPSTATALPLNTWWKHEVFDLSGLVSNTSHVMIRFALIDAGLPGPSGNKGWYLDNIKVYLSLSETNPPVITMLPVVWSGNVFLQGPYPVKALITDMSGIDTAYLTYSVDSGSNMYTGMTHLGGDTFVANLPLLPDSSNCCWSVTAVDSSPAQNQASYPSSGCLMMTYLSPLNIPYELNFDTGSPGWETGLPSNGTQWELGTPTYGTTNSPHSPPNAWDVNLSTVYTINSTCFLYSPRFDFHNIKDAKLTLWINYNTELHYDGVYIEYTQDDGNTWVTLGTMNDPKGENWYNQTYNGSLHPAWAGNSNGWLRARYDLSQFNLLTEIVRFRFVFISDISVTNSGFSFDDFSIQLPAAFDAALQSIVQPEPGCGLHEETVRLKIFNKGLDTIPGNLTASFSVGSGGPVVTEIVPDTLFPSDTLIYEFLAKAHVPANMNDTNYTVVAWVSLPGDSIHNNDTLQKTVLSKALPAPPLFSSVSTPYGTWTVLTANASLPISWYKVPEGGQAVATGTMYTTPVLFVNTVYFLATTAPNGCESVRAPDTVIITNPPLKDVTITQVITPSTSYGLTSAEVVRVVARNYGTITLDTLHLSYMINNQLIDNENLVASLASGDSVVFPFPVTSNMLAFGAYEIKAFVTFPGDQYPGNDTCHKTVENLEYTLCPSAAINTVDDDIGNVHISNINNGVASPLLSNGTSNKLYSDFTESVPPIQLIRGLTYPISVTQINSGAFYACCCKVFIDWNNDGTLTEETETAFAAGPSTSANMTFSGNIIIPMDAVEGLTHFRVVLMETGSQGNVHACGTYNWGETEDYLGEIILPFATDLKLVSIDQPNSSCNLNSAQVKVKVQNIGMTAIADTLSFHYQLDNHPLVSADIFLNLPVSGVQTITFNPVENFGPGLNDSIFHLKVWASVPGDGQHANDTLNLTVESKKTPPSPVISSVLVPVGNAAVLSASSTYPVSWYNAPSGGTLLSTQNPYSTGSIGYTQIFFVQSNAPNGCSSVRIPDTVFVGDAMYPMFLINAQGQTASSCQGRVFDNGGIRNNYGASTDDAITICSASATLDRVSLRFVLFALGTGDTLFIHDGISQLSPLIGAFPSLGIAAGQVFEASAQNASGCLTLRLKSDNTSQDLGFEALISCTTLCQDIQPALDPVSTVPSLQDSLYFDLCHSSPFVHLVGQGLYPENDLIYHQSDSTSSFSWDLGDGTLTTGLLVDHFYPQPGIYPIRLVITDSHGCSSQQDVVAIVRYEDNPVRSMMTPSPICPGSELDLTAGSMNGHHINFYNPGGGLFINDSARFIPDGGALGGYCAKTVIQVQNFPAGQTIQQGGEIQEIVASMEHSFVGDIEISVICPNGQSAVLKEYIQSGGAYLGIPLGGTNHAAFDCTNPPSCLLDPAMNPPGTGYTYSWTMDNPQHGLMNNYVNQTTVDSGSYLPDDSFANLVGCPWNGAWTFNVCDYWAIDNGWLFDWQIIPDPDVTGLSNLFVAPVDTVFWSGPCITGLTGWNAHVLACMSGNLPYQVQIQTTSGCTYDTTMFLNVLQSPEVSCTSSDSIITIGDSVILQAYASNGVPPYTFLWSNGATEDSIQVTPSGPGTYYVTVTDSLGCTGVDTVTVIVLVISTEELADRGNFWLKSRPNPFSKQLNMDYFIPDAGDVSLIIYNLAGERVITRNYGAKARGSYSITLDEEGLPSGLYLLSLQWMNENQRQVKTLRVSKQE